MQPLAVVIRPEAADDRAAIRLVNEQAFGRLDEADIVDALRDDPWFVPELSLVAELNGSIVGHALFCEVEISEECRWTLLSLGPVAVLPELQRRGIGSQLIRAGLARAVELEYYGVVILGHPEYYRRFGFEPTDDTDIRFPGDVPPGCFMAMPLVEDGLEGVAGRVTYPKAFGIEDFWA